MPANEPHSDRVIITPQGVSYPNFSVHRQLSVHIEHLRVATFFAQSELKAKIFGKSLGVFWLLLEPVLMAVVYWLLTMVLLRGTGNSYFLQLYTMVVFWRLFSRTIDNSTVVFPSSASLIKVGNVDPGTVLTGFILTEFYVFLMSFFVLLGFLYIGGETPSYFMFLLLPVLVVQIALSYAISQISSVLGVVVRDFAVVIPALTSIWFYLSPGIYDISKIPENYLYFYNLNPFSHILPAYTKIIFKNEIPDWGALGTIFFISLFLGYYGKKFRQKLLPLYYASL